MGCGASGPSKEVPKKKGYVFRVRLIGGLNLYNNSFGVQLPGTNTSQFSFNGASDPYVRLKCGDQELVSQTILHEQNPVWNQEFYFNVPTRKPVLSLKVFDAELVGSDVMIGHADIPLQPYLGKTEREIWIPLNGAKANGEIGIAVIECYRSKITAKSGTGVAAMDSLSGSSDCYLTMQVGQQPRMKTAVAPWTLSPIWNNTFEFYFPYGIASQLELILWDHDTVGVDCNMGWAYVKFDGKPQDKPQEFKQKLTRAQGELEFTVADDTLIEAPEVPAPTEAELKARLPIVPQTATFQCTIIGAYNLAAADVNYAADFLDAAAAELFHIYKENNEGTSDPFCRVTCEGQVYDTRHINNTLEPWWNQKFRFVARNKDSSELSINVIDHDIVGQNDAIGGVKIPLNMMKPGERTEMWSFLDKGRGELGIELEMDFQLKIKIIECKDLPAKDLNGMCDPFVKITVAGKTYQTRTIRDNRSPWIEEDFRFAIPSLKNQKMKLEVLDADFQLFAKGSAQSFDLIGSCEVPLDNIKHGIPNEMTLPLTYSGKASKDGKNEGTIRFVVLDEIPLPQSALDLLAAKGKEAFDDAVKKLTETKDLIKTLKLPDFEKKQEAEIEPCDPKIADRPRYTRINVKAIATRGYKDAVPPVWLGISIPLQGERKKTIEYKDPNADCTDEFTFRVPTKTVSTLQVELFESGKQPQNGPWPTASHSKAIIPLRKLNGGDGLIRGSPANDTHLDTGKGKIVVRVTELFRFNVRVIGGKGVALKADPYVRVEFDRQNYRTNTVPADPKKDRTEGIPGEPRWNEQFTFFSAAKGPVKFILMDNSLTGDTNLGTATFDLGKLRRGIPVTETIQLDKGGELTIWAKEEEKMALIDQIFDAAGNAARLIQAAAGEAAAAVQNAVGDIGGKISGGLGGLFGK